MFAPIFGPLGTWALGILIVVSLMGLSFVKGMAYEGDRRLVIEAKQDAERKDIIKVVEREVEVIRTVYGGKKQVLEKDRDIAILKVIEHAKALPDPPQCYLAPERVHTINDAWGVGSAPNPVQRSGVMPGGATPPIGKPQ